MVSAYSGFPSAESKPQEDAQFDLNIPPPFIYLMYICNNYTHTHVMGSQNSKPTWSYGVFLAILCKQWSVVLAVLLDASRTVERRSILSTAR